MDEDEREAEELMESLRKQADRWRERLADPAMRLLIEAKRVKVSPLVERLLDAFPPNSGT